MKQNIINEKQFMAFQFSKIKMLSPVRGWGLAGVGATSLGGIPSTIIELAVQNYISLRAYLFK